MQKGWSLLIYFKGLKMHITGQLTFSTGAHACPSTDWNLFAQKVLHVWRQTIPGTRINTDDVGRGRQHKHPLGNFLTSSVKRLNLWTCANGHKIIMKGLVRVDEVCETKNGCILYPMKHVGNVQKPITFLSLSAAIANFLLTFNSKMEKEKKWEKKLCQRVDWRYQNYSNMCHHEQTIEQTWCSHFKPS